MTASRVKGTRMTWKGMCVFGQVSYVYGLSTIAVTMSALFKRDQPPRLLLPEA